METRTWLFVALLAAACVSLIQAEDEELPPNNIAETDTGSNDNAEETNPNAEETNPNAEETNPNAEETNPNAEETNPNAEETNLAGPADNNTGVQDDNQEGDQGSSSGPSITTSASSSETTTEEVETVTKKEFDIIGVRMKSYLGRNFNAFCGIPYAEPPINKRRFKNPVPMTYDGTIDATNCEETPVCMQMRWHQDETEVIGVEDCLFLNVYEPEVTSSNLPVIVYIHGGGFFSGSGTFNDVGPHYFMDQDIVLVTINYRLGPLGFWGTNTHNAPNNLGLRDQVLALEWVRHYIGHFRGDKYRVTLMGEGAGGASVQLHLYSSMSRHLFHRAISQSGVAFNSWALMKDMVTPSYTHASIIGCFETTEARLLRCMQTVDAAIIVNTTAGLRSWLSEPLVIYRPAVQSRFGHDEIFLKKEIMHYLMTNNFHNVPWLVGTVNTPSFFHLQRYLKDEKLRSSLLGKFQQFGAKMLDLDASIADPMKLETAFKIISAAYSDSTGKLDKDGIVQIFNDREGNLGLMLTVAYHALLGHKNLYLYRFEYRGQHSMAENITGVKEDEVVNGDDLIYLMRQPKLFPDFDRSTEEGKRDFQMMRKLTAIWAEFAATGEVKALYRNKRATATLSQEPTDTGDAGLLPEAEIENSEPNISSIDDLMNVEKDGESAVKVAEKYMWENFVDHDWQNKSSCSDNYASMIWPAVKRFPSTPGNVRILPYLSFRKGGNDTPVAYCLQYLMEFDRIRNWLNLNLHEVRLPDDFMIVYPPPTQPWGTSTAPMPMPTTDHPCPTFYVPPEVATDSIEVQPPVQLPVQPPVQPPQVASPALPPTWYPAPQPTTQPTPQPPMWAPTAVAPYPGQPTPQPPMWAPTAVAPYPGQLPPDIVLPQPVHPQPSELEEPASAEQSQYSWPRRPKPPAPPPRRYPQVDFNLPPPAEPQVADAKPFPVRPTPPGRPTVERQLFTWEINSTETEEEVTMEPPRPHRPRPSRPKPHRKPKSSASPRSREVWSYTSLLLLLLLVVQF